MSPEKPPARITATALALARLLGHAQLAIDRPGPNTLALARDLDAVLAAEGWRIVSAADLDAALAHLDAASRAAGGEPCQASFVTRLR